MFINHFDIIFQKYQFKSFLKKNICFFSLSICWSYIYPEYPLSDIYSYLVVS